MREDTVNNKVLEIFKSNFKQSKNINYQTKFDEIDEWDSLGFTILIKNIEDSFKIEFELEEMLDFDSVESIVTQVSVKLNKR